MAAIKNLIADTERWLAANRAAGRQVEALACRIRLVALRDALKAIGGSPTPE
jgi:hypothetical protein